MGVMTNGAFQFLDRFVDHFAAKGYFFVALKTDLIGKGLSSDSQMKTSQSKERYKE